MPHATGTLAWMLSEAAGSVFAKPKEASGKGTGTGTGGVEPRSGD